MFPSVSPFPAECEQNAPRGCPWEVEFFRTSASEVAKLDKHRKRAKLDRSVEQIQKRLRGEALLFTPIF